MATTTALLDDQVLEALAIDENHPRGSAGYDTLAPYLPAALIAAVGDQLDDKVEFTSLCNIEARYLRNMADNDELIKSLGLEGVLVVTLYHEMADQLDDIAGNADAFLSEKELTADEAMHLDSLRLNDDMLLAYDEGKLTYRLLITQQPGLFIPQ
jgi:hypothetical protein